MTKQKLKRAKTRARITLRPGAILSNVVLDGCFLVIRGPNALVKECHFRNDPGEIAIHVKEKRKQ